jgi:hypothetical protein
MFTQPSIPRDKILTRYIAPFGLTALLRPAWAGQPGESLWVDGEGECGIVLFVAALDAEIYRLYAQTIGEEWVRHPLETIGLSRRKRKPVDRQSYRRAIRRQCFAFDCHDLRRPLHPAGSLWAFTCLQRIRGATRNGRLRVWRNHEIGHTHLLSSVVAAENIHVFLAR